MHFPFQGTYYGQVEEAAIGSQISSIVANVYMKYFKDRVLETEKTH